MQNLRRKVALVLVAPVLTVLPIATAHAASTCHGRPATIEASSGTVTGTPGDDVIVVTGTVRSVEARDGNDLVCLVDTRKLGGYRIFIYVDSGSGNDEVDAAEAGAHANIRLGPGADSFIGSPFNDHVTMGTRPPDGTAGDAGPYLVTTGPGEDSLVVLPGAVVDARLGKGADSLGFFQSYAGPESRYDLGPGDDSVGFEDYWDEPGAGDTSLLADLSRGVVTWRGVTSTVLNAENLGAYARRVVVRGNHESNRLSAHGCTVLLKGRGGEDSLFISSATQDVAPDLGACSGSRLRAYGNAGDDYLRGGSRHEVLIGGPGRDRAFGGRGGRDRCDAEQTWGKGCRR